MKEKLLIFLFFLVSFELLGVSLKLADRFELSQEKHIIQSIYSFCVTGDGYIFAADRKACDIKIFSPDGKMIRAWGRKGAGPNEFLKPLHIEYKKGKLVLVDKELCSMS